MDPFNGGGSHAFLDIISTYGAWIFFGLFVLAIAGWEMWQFRIRPMLVPKAKIEAMVDALIARYGADAEQMTYGEEDRAWRYSDTFKQGVLRRVRHELWRRYEAGMGIAPAINRAGRQTNAHAAALEWPFVMMPAACALIDEPERPARTRR